VKGHRRIIVIATAALVAAVLAAALVTSPWGNESHSGAASSDSATIPQPSLDKLGKLTRSRIAPGNQRVDLGVPTFSNPTNITNPLFPIGKLQSALLLGRYNGNPWRAETTLLPDTRTVEWHGQQIETLQSQFVAYFNGRIYEVAIDHYAQSDDGAVWYFGEDALSYKNGLVSDVGETWHADVEGPATMIMPGHPQVGDVYRAENIPGLIFEQVTVKKVGETVNGPSGPVAGAMVGQELHMEGDLESKTFAPGYGEFFSGLGRDVEATALAMPADSRSPQPAELGTLSTRANHLFDAVGSRNWNAAAGTAHRMSPALDAFQAGEVPERIYGELNNALDSVNRAVRARRARQGSLAALDAAQASLDLQPRRRPTVEVNVSPFDLWARQFQVDAAAGDFPRGDRRRRNVEWIRDRIPLASSDANRVDDMLRYLRAAAQAEQLTPAADAAAGLSETIVGLQPTT
jgi:hypothetical protein